jgi:hypothetical protein
LLVALAALWTCPVSAHPDPPAPAPKCHASECKPARAKDDARTPTAKAPSGDSNSHSWFSFFRRQSSVLLP